MKSIRIGNDIRFRFSLRVLGDAKSVKGLPLTVEVVPSERMVDNDRLGQPEMAQVAVERVVMNGCVQERPLLRGKKPKALMPVVLPCYVSEEVVDGERRDVLYALWSGDKQFATGEYDVVVWGNKGRAGQTVADAYRAVRLVGHSAQADIPATEPQGTDTEAVIDMGVVELTLGVGLSAYELACLDGFVGTRSEWLASLRGPAGASSIEYEGEEWSLEGVVGRLLALESRVSGYHPPRFECGVTYAVCGADGGEVRPSGVSYMVDGDARVEVAVSYMLSMSLYGSVSLNSASGSLLWHENSGRESRRATVRVRCEWKGVTYFADVTAEQSGREEVPGEPSGGDPGVTDYYVGVGSKSLNFTDAATDFTDANKNVGSLTPSSKYWWMAVPRGTGVRVVDDYETDLLHVDADGAWGSMYEDDLRDESCMTCVELEVDGTTYLVLRLSYVSFRGVSMRFVR